MHRVISKRSNKECGSGSSGIIVYMLGFSLIYFIFYFVLNWIYETKEERKLALKAENELTKVVTKEEVMKRGIGQYVFKCYAFLGNSCYEHENYKSTPEFQPEAKVKKENK